MTSDRSGWPLPRRSRRIRRKSRRWERGWLVENSRLVGDLIAGQTARNWGARSVAGASITGPWQRRLIPTPTRKGPFLAKANLDPLGSLAGGDRNSLTAAAGIRHQPVSPSSPSEAVRPPCRADARRLAVEGPGLRAVRLPGELEADTLDSRPTGVPSRPCRGRQGGQPGLTARVDTAGVSPCPKRQCQRNAGRVVGSSISPVVSGYMRHLLRQFKASKLYAERRRWAAGHTQITARDAGALSRYMTRPAWE